MAKGGIPPGCFRKSAQDVGFAGVAWLPIREKRKSAEVTDFERVAATRVLVLFRLSRIRK